MDGFELFNRLQKPAKKVKEPKPLRQVGKVGKARQADRKDKLKAEPANHQGYRQCYIGLESAKAVDLEHVIDPSIRPDLRHNEANHRLACNDHNVAKKEGRLTEAEQRRVDRATEEVLKAIGE